MSDTVRSAVIHLDEAQTKVPGPGGEHAVRVFERGRLDVRLANAPPVPPAVTTPHEQDEVYVIVRGRGVLFHDGKRNSFRPGDLMFVAAGTHHRFEDYTEDLVVWVVFYGPRGGDQAGR